MTALLAAAVGQTSLGQGSASAVDGGTIYVAAGGSGGNGTSEAPFGSLAQAVAAAPNGATIQLAAGVYHEQVQVYRKELHIVGGDGVVLDGAARLDGWTADNGNYSVAWQPMERVGKPFVTDQHPVAGSPEQVFVNGVELTEVLHRDLVAADTFFVDTAANKLTVGVDPATHDVEVSRFNYGLYLNRAHGSSVSNVTVQRYATPRAHMASIRAYSNNVTLHGVTVQDNSHMGISAMGDDITITDSVVQRSGYIGLHGHLADRLVVEGVTIADNNIDSFNAYHAAAGLKVTTSDNIRVANNVATGNNGPGLWTDLQVLDSDIVNNTATDNERSGIQIELSDGIVVAGNTVTGNKQRGIWILESSDADVWNNFVVDNQRELWIEDGPRADLKDVRFHNNVLGGAANGSEAIILVDDWTEVRSTADMNVSGDRNAYWAPQGSAPQFVSRLAQWPARLERTSTLADHQQVAGFDTNSIISNERVNPFIDFVEVGTPLSARVAQALGLEAGAWVGIGTNLEVVRPIYVPQGLSVEAGIATLTASWSRPVGGQTPAQYVVLVDGREHVTVTDTTATVDVAAGTRHVQVQAVAADGTRSKRTAPVKAEIESVTTVTAPATTVPPTTPPPPTTPSTTAPATTTPTTTVPTTVPATTAPVTTAPVTTTTVPATTTPVTTAPVTTTPTATIPPTTTPATTAPVTTAPVTTTPTATVPPTTTPAAAAPTPTTPAATGPATANPVAPTTSATKIYAPEGLWVGDIGLVIAAWNPPTYGETPVAYAVFVNGNEIERVANPITGIVTKHTGDLWVQIQSIAADGTRSVKTAPFLLAT